ncbi:hypothetical protein BY458DRAFT_567371 [Sporodiniella umbellata]|nr:hypothetical protein BY458DRAFT_567371 [Sporodiniella umbellata]
MDTIQSGPQFQKALDKHSVLKHETSRYTTSEIVTEKSLGTRNDDKNPSNIPALENLANLVSLDYMDVKKTQINNLLPREQEKDNENLTKAVHCMFNNKFMKAKKIFESKARTEFDTEKKSDPTLDSQTAKETINLLTSVYHMASAQIDKATNKHVGHTIVNYFSTCRQYIRLSKALPTHIKPSSPKKLETDTAHFIPNGVLRAYVAKGEACLQIAIIYLLQESCAAYTKCGLNLRRAYVNYSIVWQEYKRLGQTYDEYIDRDTIAGMQFGIGSIHLILSLLPPNILQRISAFAWKPDQHLGFVLLELCIESRRKCSPMASLMLLTYYTSSISLCSQVLSTEYIQPALKTLLDAQQIYPNSALFLYFAGHIARVANNMLLSSQSFEYTIQVAQGDWAEADMESTCKYELAINHMIAQRWEQAYTIFLNHPSSLFLYLSAACLSMMGDYAKAILTYAQVADFNGLDKRYISHKIKLLQQTGYQDIGFSLNALEYLYLNHNITGAESLQSVDDALYKILDIEKLEHQIRTQELFPETSPPDYDRQRGNLLLLKIAILNNMGQHRECIIHLNWIIDHQKKMSSWVIAYTYWEAGTTCWNLQQKEQAVSFWEKSLKFKGYDFEERLVMRVNLALKHAKDLGICSIKLKEQLRLNSSIICDPFYDNYMNDCKTESSDEGNGSTISSIDIEIENLGIEVNESIKY